MKLRRASRHVPVEQPVEDAEAGEAIEAAEPGRRSRIARHGVRGLKVGVVMAVVLVGTFAAAAAAFALYDVYGTHPDRTAASWAAHTPQYADMAICQRCHAREYAEQQASQHGTVSCESCHGPLASHAVAESPGPVDLASAAGRCVNCHTAVTGRPADFPQIDPATHFGSGACVRCHDPHSVIAVAPPPVSHPLDRLPACTVCHKPDGLKSLPSGHEEAPDAVCLSCHSVESASR